MGKASDALAGSDVPVEMSVVLLGTDCGEYLAAAEAGLDVACHLLSEGERVQQLARLGL